MLYIKVIEGEVKECIDSLPEDMEGWRECIEYKPDLKDGRERYGDFVFMLDSNPAQLIWPVLELDIETRKEAMKAQCVNEFVQFYQNQLITILNTRVLDSAGIEEQLRLLAEKQAAVETAGTHDQLDQLK